PPSRDGGWPWTRFSLKSTKDWVEFTGLRGRGLAFETRRIEDRGLEEETQAVQKAPATKPRSPVCRPTRDSRRPRRRSVFIRRFRSRRLGERQANREPGPLALTALHVDGPALRLDRLAHDRQAAPSAGAFGGVTQLENLREPL